MPCMSRSNFRVSPCAGSVHSKSPWISSAVKYLNFHQISRSSLQIGTGGTLHCEPPEFTVVSLSQNLPPFGLSSIFILENVESGTASFAWSRESWPPLGLAQNKTISPTKTEKKQLAFPCPVDISKDIFECGVATKT